MMTGGCDTRQVLFGLADVLGDHPAQIDPVDIQRHLVLAHLGGLCLAGANRAREDGMNPVSAVGPSIERLGM